MAEVSNTSSINSANTKPTTTANTSKFGALGLGSKNKLSDELLNKLKEADKAAQIDPITRKIAKNKDINEDIKAVIKLLDNVNSNFSKLTDESNYAKRKVTSSGTSATIEVAAGVNAQDLSLDVIQLAQRDSFKTDKFTNPLSLIGITSDSNFDIEIRGVKYSIDLKQSSTYQDLVDTINERAGADVQARLINVGNGYQMILQSKSTGESNSIKITSNSGNALEKLGWDNTLVAAVDENNKPILNSDGSAKMITNLEKNRLTSAQNAKFNYNGLEITRTTNKFSDLRPGVDITLQDTGKSNFSVVQDSENLVKILTETVASYNTLIENLEKATSYNKETKESGFLQGINEVSSIRGTLNRLLTNQDSNGKSINQYGITMNEKGVLEFDSSVFLSKVAKDANDVKDFFMGSAKTETISYFGKSVSAGSLSLSNGDLKINDVSVKLEPTDTNSSPKDNALALLKAINSAGILGLNASLSPDQTRVILKTGDGSDIEIKGNNSILEKFGMNEQTINAKTTTTHGIFSKLNDEINKITLDTPGLEDEKKGTLVLYSNRLTKESKSMEDEKTKAQENLDKRYEQMRETWTKYDAKIAELENQFATLKAMIDAEINSKK